MLTFLGAAGCKTVPQGTLVEAIDFKKELSPYGEWIVVSPYGRLWHPSTRIVGKDFVPYVSGGRWVHGERGWSFESRWDWGKLAFHYGRWVYVNDLDWLWSPDPEWAPAWVEWRFGGGHVGWSPIGPPVRSPRPQRPRWTFVKARYFAQRDVDRFLVAREDASKLEGRTEALSGTSGRSGPAAEQIAAEGGLERDPKHGFRAPDLPVPAAPAAEVAPPMPEQDEVDQAPAPPRPPKHPKKPKKKRR